MDEAYGSVAGNACDVVWIAGDHLDDVTTPPGSRRRLRLLSPYKEHFAQAFARFFMRIGLPHDAGAFATAGKSQVSDLK